MNANNINYEKNIIDHREYNIENNEYNLRIEIDKEYIYFKLTKLSQSLEYFYRNKIDFQTVLQKFDLNPSNHSNFELKIFDKINKKNKISIKINDDNSCNLIIKILDYIEEEEKIKEIKLYKEYMNDKDKFNILYNEIKLIKKERNKIESNKEIEEMKNKILNELNINMKKREEGIKDILNEKDKIIKEMNEKIIKQDNEINEIKRKNINEIINKRINEIENKLFNLSLFIYMNFQKTKIII